MLPVLLDLKFIKIYTFGIFLVLAFFWGSFLLWRLTRLTVYKEEEIFDGLFLGLLGSILFGRFVYVILNFKSFGFSILKFILINGYPGLSIYGALAGGLLFLFLYFHSKKIKFKEVVDYWITPIFVGLAIGKLGSFFSGAEIGSKTKFLLSIKYVGFDGLRHLTPFYESIFFFLGTYLSYKLIFEIRKEKLFQGFVLYFFIWYFSLTYFIFDKIKGNQLYFLELNFNRGLSLGLLLTFSAFFIYYFRSSINSGFKKYGQKAYQKTLGRFRRTTSKRSQKAAKPGRRA